MWHRYDGATVREELAVLAEYGCNVTRSFCAWPEFVPAPEQLDEELLERFKDFLDAHLEAGLGTLPTLIVGHMSGENRDPVWREGRDLYGDVWMVTQQAWFVEQLGRRFRSHPAIAGWVLTNEMPLYGGERSASEVTAWARLLVQALRASGARQPVSVGDGAWGIEVSGHDNGFRLRELSRLADFVGPHSYPMEDDQVRQMLTPAFVCELAHGFNRPVVLEEFGLTSDFAGDEHAAAYYRQVLYATLVAGARGWLAWCNSDYDAVRELDPYRHHVFELHFGLTDSAGRPKPQLHVLGEFAQFVSGLDQQGWSRIAGGVALVVPEHFEHQLPFTSPEFRQDIRANLQQAYVNAREADLPVQMMRERDGLQPGPQLYLLPCTKLLTAPGIDRLRVLAGAGATVYLSHFAGSTAIQRGPWLSWLDELFGVRHQLRYGLVEPIEEDEVTFDFLEDLGDIPAGATLRFSAAGSPSARCHLPVESLGATVIAVDGRGRPALLRHALGAGQTILCTYPLEHMAAVTPAVNPEPTWRLYSALAELAGVQRPLRVADPRVLVGCLRAGGGELAVLANCSPDTVIAQPIGPGYPATEGVTLAPFGVEVVRLPQRPIADEPSEAAPEPGGPERLSATGHQAKTSAEASERPD
jgi:endo-1,4-beta-mannosidase